MSIKLVESETDTLTVDQYHAAVRRLNLRPSNVPHVFTCTDDGQQYNVPNASEFTSEERFEIIERLTRIIHG